ncbi:MAG: ROK family protein [Anaerolineae bacterium]|nr:ROK family protein [Anaerolineae bacterium]
MTVLPHDNSAAAIPPQRVAVAWQEKEIFDRIRRQGEATKAELVNRLPYSRTKINQCIADLLEKGLVKTAGAGDYTGGRRAVTYSVNGSAALVAGVDIGATSVDLALADLAGKIYARLGEPADVRDGPRLLLGRVGELLEQMLAGGGLARQRLLSIGVGVPGPVDFKLGKLVSPPIMPGWDGFPIIATLQERFPTAHVAVDNDVNIMALGEKVGGAARHVDNLIFVKIGTGIGAGILCNGEIYRGSNGCAGDIGHICVNKEGPICRCGNIGCLEAMAAGPAIAAAAQKAALEGKSPILLRHYEANGGFLRPEDVGYSAGEGDPVSIDIIRNSGHLVGDVLASLVNFYNPGMIVIGGGVSKIGNLLLSSIRQVVLHRSLPLATRDMRIIFSQLGDEAGVTGAMALAVENLFVVQGYSE